MDNFNIIINYVDTIISLTSVETSSKTNIDIEIYFKIYDIILSSNINVLTNLINQIKSQYDTQNNTNNTNNTLNKLFAELDFINNLIINQTQQLDQTNQVQTDLKQLLYDNISNAVQYGHVNLIKYCYEEYGTLDSDVINNALLYGQLDILIFLYQVNEYCLNKEWACRKAVIGSNIKCLRYVHSIGAQLDLESLLYAIKYDKTDCFDYIMENINLLSVIGLANVTNLADLTDLTNQTNQLDLTDLTELVDTIVTQQQTKFNSYYFDKIIKSMGLLCGLAMNQLINLSLTHSNSDFLMYGLTLITDNNNSTISHIKINPSNIITSIETDNLTCFFIIYEFILSNKEKYPNLFELFESITNAKISEVLIKKNDISLINFLIKHKFKLNDKCALQASLIALKTNDFTILNLLVEENNCPLSSDIISAVINGDRVLSINIINYLLQHNIEVSDENYFLAFFYNRLDIIELFIEYNNDKINKFIPNYDVIIGAVMSKDIHCVKYCNELLKSIYTNQQTQLSESTQTPFDELLKNSNAIAHAVKLNIIEIVDYLLSESYEITSEAMLYGAMFNSIESLEIILLIISKQTDSNKIIDLITTEAINSAIAYDNIDCLKLFIKYGHIQLTKANIICCFENDSFKCMTYICSLVYKEIISDAYNEIDQKILTNEIKEYLIKNNLIKLS